MIQTFKNKALEKLLKENIKKGIPPNFRKEAQNSMEVIDAAETIEDIRLPGYDLHELKGDREDTGSIKVSANWRVTFQFQDGDAYDVDLKDYH